MPAGYAHIFKFKGTAAFFLVSLPSRIGLAMISMAAIVLVTRSTGSYGTAGGVVAAFAIAGAVGGPLTARLSDRIGQTRTLVGCVSVHVVMLGGLTVLALRGAATLPLCLAAAGAGASMPSIGSLTRARWAHVLRGTPYVSSAFALESLTDDFSYVVGPAAAVLLATHSPSAGTASAALLVMLGGFGLAMQRRTAPPCHRIAARVFLGALAVPGMAGLVVAFVGIGSVFGSMQVSVNALTDAHDVPHLAGPIYSVFALASMLSAVCYGAIRWRASPTRRLTWSLAGLTAGCLLLPYAVGPWSLAVLIFLPGLGISPALISGNACVEQIVPRSRLTEALAWLGGAGGLGVAAGAAVSGHLVKASAPSLAFFVVGASAAAAFLFYGLRRTLC